MHALTGFQRAFSRFALTVAAVVVMASGSAQANPKYAGYVYDANPDKVLSSENADPLEGLRFTGAQFEIQLRLAF